MSNIKIGIAGCMGRMGKEILREVYLNPKTLFAGGFENPNHKFIGENIGSILNLDLKATVGNNAEEVFINSDVVIDFTTPKSTLENIKFAKDYKTPIVIGTTGLTEENINTIVEISKSIPIIQSANMSIGINLILDLTEKASKILKAENYDVEISETHHKHKIDAPSGTAIELGKSVASGRSVDLEEKKVEKLETLDFQ